MSYKEIRTWQVKLAHKVIDIDLSKSGNKRYLEECNRHTNLVYWN